MKRSSFGVFVFVVGVLLLGLALPLSAQSDPQILGTFSEPFTTFAVVGDLVHPGELDWYTFDIASESATIFVLADGLAGGSGILALLFDADDTYVDVTNDGFLEAVLSSGTYRIRVDSTDSAVQSYSLVVLNGLEIESNDGLVESNDLGELAGSVRLFASAVPAGDADFYRFQVSENGLPNDANALLIRTDGPTSGDTFLVLYQYDEGEGRYLPIAFDDDSGDSYWSQLLVRPQPGDRFAVRVEETVFPLEGIENYSLFVIPVFLTADDEPNNTSTQATELVPESGDALAWSVEGLLDANDTIDFFTVTIEASALVQIYTEAQESVGDYDTLLALYTPDGTLLAESDDSGDTGWSRVSLVLEAGNYVITVEVDEYAAPLLPYRLRATATSVRTVSETEPNDTDETAELVEWVGEEALLIEATIGSEGDIDSYKFVLGEAATVTFETGPRSGSAASNDTTLAIYDEDLWEIAFNDDANGSWSRLEQALDAGTYYIVVEGYFEDETFDYSLLITVNE